MNEARKVLDQFKKEKSQEEIFYHMCFAICAPQANFVGNKIANQKLIDNDFYNKDLDNETLLDIVRHVRFKKKAVYLRKAKEIFPQVLEILQIKNDFEKREQLVKLIPGIGLKAASHFLRNMGCEHLAIIDIHILRYLNEEGMAGKFDYYRIERNFKQQAKDQGITPAELDAEVWKNYSNTSWENFTY